MIGANPQVSQPVMLAPNAQTGLIQRAAVQSAPPLLGGEYTVNPGTVSSRSMRGMQYAQANPDGTSTIYQSPTTAATTQLQNRMAAHGEVMGLGEPVIAGLLPYMGTGGRLSLVADRLRTALPDGLKDIMGSGIHPLTDLNGQPIKDQNGQPVMSTPEQRLAAYTYAQNNIPGLAAAVGRFDTGGHPSEGYIKQVEDSALSSHWATPQAQAQQALLAYLPQQEAAFGQAIQPSLQSYPNTIQGKPNWPGQNAPQMPTIFTGDSKKDKASIAQFLGHSPASAQAQAPAPSPAQAPPQSSGGWNGNQYVHDDGSTYTRAQLEAIAAQGNS
jgi:hypothetical protein